MTYKILVVDDSKLARMSVAKALTTLRPDWTRLEASNADEALVLVDETQIDIALLDFNMPGRDGLDLAKELRLRRPRMPVAVISANHQSEIVERARQVGAVFLTKPISEKTLGEFIEVAVRQLEGGAR